MRVYFGSPFPDALHVRRLHLLARMRGLEPVSAWAETSDGPEELERMPLRTVRTLAAQNDRDLLSAHVVVILAREGAGGEMFAEARLALAHGIPVIWVGARRPLTAYREGVLRINCVPTALRVLTAFAALANELGLDDADSRFLIWTLIEQLEERGHAPEAADYHPPARGAAA